MSALPSRWSWCRACFFSVLGIALISGPGSRAMAQVGGENHPSVPKVLRLQPSSGKRVWEGWGVSLCWWGKVFGARDDLADAFFKTGEVKVDEWTLPGLGLNIVRYNAGACSWNEVNGKKMAVSKIILPYRQMEGFWLDGKESDPDSPSWDWNVDAGQRAMLLKAKERGANHFELFSNSPMWWMCRNGNPSGAAGKTENNLAPEQYRNFAAYISTVARRAKEKWGVAFTSVEPFNEPISGWWFDNCKQEGCYFSPASQADFLPNLRGELDARGLKDLEIAASDETSYSHALKTWRSLNSGARAIVGRVNVHGYEGTKGPRDSLYQEVVEEAGKPLWNSEYGDKLEDGMEMARCIQLDFQQLRPTAWCYWQALDGGGWGLIRAEMSKSQLLGVNTKYYVLAHYTRHIRPGMEILRTDDSDATGAFDPQGNKLVLVLLNRENSSQEWRASVAGFRIPEGPVKVWKTEFRGGTHYQSGKAEVKNGTISLSLPPFSIWTVEAGGPEPIPHSN